MTNKKRMAAMLLAGAMTVGTMAGCGGSNNAEAPAGSAAGSAASGETKGSITVITMALNSDFWHEVQAGAILAGQELGYEINVIGPNDESNAQEQCNQIMDAVASGADAIVLAANNPDTVVSTAAEAHATGIPLIEIAQEIPDEDAYDAYYGTNNYNAGSGLGEFITENQEDAHIGIIRGLVGAVNHDLRCDGITDAAEENGGTIVDIQPADSDRAKAVTVAENLMQANPELTAIAATSDDMALGAYEAVKAAGKTDEIKVYGFDASLGGLESIMAGELTADAGQLPIEMGRGGVELAVKVLNGEEVEKENECPYEMVSIENAQQVYDDSIQSLKDAGFDY
ncbi:MAG: sugar ABC transporter substrate-binding protein [Eubacteriales bacterium]|nr:sugar ABC transporter substrate-binding protein [Eubacteriales bacterium]